MTDTIVKHRPQVLLLGNGLNIEHGGKKWSELINSIKTNPAFSGEINCPEPLQAIIATEDHVDRALKDKEKRKEFYGTVKAEDKCQRGRLNRILTIGFDCILTTNYSYELECVAFDVESVSDYRLKKHLRFLSEDGIKQAEPKYLLHTYCEVEMDGIINKIFHIHGEARKPDSMILGHYYYGSLLKRYFQLLDKRGNIYLEYQRKGDIFPIRSWLDAFIIGDVYILGFGYDLSEFDLWWLLNRKKREKADVGKTYFYTMPNEGDDKEKLELLKLMNVTIKDIGMKKSDSSYDSFYSAAVEDISRHVNQNRDICQ